MASQAQAQKKKFSQSQSTESPDPKKNHFFPKDLDPSPTPKTKKKRKWPLFLFFSFIFICLLALPPVIFVSWYISSFSQAADLSPSQLFSMARAADPSKIPNHQGKTNILILGLDKISGQKENSRLTDTIILGSLDLQSSSLNLVSIPRDLWIQDYQTKINSLYYYGEKNPDTTGIEFLTMVINDYFGLPIHYYYILDLDILAQVIDSIGGVDVDVPRTFTDTRFPKTNTDPNSKNPEDLFETITFEQGLKHMDGSTALKFIRSRQSQDPTEGTDIARSNRQTILIQSLKDKISSFDILKNPHRLGTLFFLYQQINSNLKTEDLIAIAKATQFKKPNLYFKSIPIQTDTQEGLLYNPPLQKHQLWVYEPVDPTWEKLKLFLEKQL